MRVRLLCPGTHQKCLVIVCERHIAIYLSFVFTFFHIFFKVYSNSVAVARENQNLLAIFLKKLKLIVLNHNFEV